MRLQPGSPSSLRVLTHREKLSAAPAHQFFRTMAPELIEVPDERGLQELRRRLLIGMRATNGLRYDLVNHVQLEQILRRDAHRARRPLLHFHALAILPQDRRTPL